MKFFHNNGVAGFSLRFLRTLKCATPLLMFFLAITLNLNAAYIGSKKCAKCHRKEFRWWTGDRHFKAFTKLKEKQQKDMDCLRCHTLDARVKFWEFKYKYVGCESCHGEGSLYAKKSVMRNKGLAMQKGLKLPSETLCKTCHNKSSPNFLPFDYKKAKQKIVHWKEKKQ